MSTWHPAVSSSQLAHYSRALRVGDMVLQSGTTAIDRQGNVRGDGDVAQQVDAIMKIAAWSMGKAGGRLDDVVRSRIYVTDIAVADAAARAVAATSGMPGPPPRSCRSIAWPGPSSWSRSSSTPSMALALPARRIASGGPLENDLRVLPGAPRGRSRLHLGLTALRPAASTGPATSIARRGDDGHDLPRAGRRRRRARRLVYSKTFLTDLAGADNTRALLEALGEVRPVSTLLGIPALVRPDLLVEIEAEAMLGRRAHGRDIYTEHMREKPARICARGGGGRSSLRERLHLDVLRGESQAAGDWARQSDLRRHHRLGARAGRRLARRRGAPPDVHGGGREANRAYGEGPAPFAKSHPTSLGCRISGLARPEFLVEVEVTAVKGAARGHPVDRPGRRGPARRELIRRRSLTSSGSREGGWLARQ